MTGAGVEVAPWREDPWRLRDELAHLWVAATEAGGAIGFRPPVDVATVQPAVDALLAEVEAATTRLVVAQREHRLIGLVGATPGPAPRLFHRVRLVRLQVHPSEQGAGVGARLVRGAEALAVRSLDAELALVEIRDGLGLEVFYERLGYERYGVVPGGLAFEDGERVDELLYLRRLHS